MLVGRCVGRSLVGWLVGWSEIVVVVVAVSKPAYWLSSMPLLTGSLYGKKPFMSCGSLSLTAAVNALSKEV